LRYCINSASRQLLETETETTAVIGGGCFWCTEAVFQRLEGVSHVESGYTGGSVKNPTYREVCNGTTGHAEVIKVTYDPSVLSLADLLRIHLTTHDPTTLNRQGYDQGTQYRSVIYYQSEKERQTAEEVVAEMSDYFDDPIVTEISPLGVYYTPEGYHQNYYNENSNQGYCQAVINPKLSKLRAMYKDRLKAVAS